jgi:cytochrome d ubiquinol oxidase subunit I
MVGVSSLLAVSALGIYIHSIFLSMSLGLPWVIMALLYKYWRTKDEDYFKAVHTVTAVLGLNFALGAITGTLVEFGLVQAWPGTIFVVATFGFLPLTLELVAFAGEIVILVMFIVTLEKVRPPVSIVIMAVYLATAALSGAIITGVNSWLNVPWGTSSLASNLYPFLPQFGPGAADPLALLRLKVALIAQELTSSVPPSAVLQDPTAAQSIGLTLSEPFILFASPYTIASILHNVNAGMIIGISFALVGYGYRFFKTGNVKHVKIMRAFLPILLVLLILQPTVLGDTMGKMVAAYQPTKFALLEGIQTTQQNPLIGFLGYGDPSHPVTGFDTLQSACNSLGEKTLGGLVSSLLPNAQLGSAASLKLSALCLADLAEAGSKMVLLNGAFYTKIASGIIALITLVGLIALSFKLGVLSRLVERILAPLGRNRSIFLLTVLVFASTASAAALGWMVREVGRAPWTVYGLLYPEELVTPVSMNPIVFALFVVVFVGIAVAGLYGMYIIAMRPPKFTELLKKGAGVE